MYVKRKDYRMRITTAKLLAAALAAALFAMTFCISSAWGSSENQKELESSDPVFTQIDCETFDGERFTAADLKDAKLTVFNVWETTCPACLGEMPDLEKLLKKHGTDDFQLVGVCADLYDKDGDLKAQRLEKAKGQMEKAGATFPHIIPDEAFSSYIHSVVIAYPTTFLVDSDGNLIASTCGAKSMDEWEEYIYNQLEELP